MAPGRDAKRLLGVLALLVLFLPTAAAHAGVLRADPSPGTRVAQSPTSVWIEFNEPVDASQTHGRVLDVNQTPVDFGDLRHEAPRFYLGLPPGLPDGVYRVQWETVSTIDGHPSEVTYGFAVGNTTAVIPPVELQQPAFPWFSVLAKALSFIGLGLVVGHTALNLWLKPADPMARVGRTREVVAWTGGWLRFAGLVLLLLDGARISNAPVHVYAGLNEFGRGLAVRLLLALAALAALRFASPDRLGRQTRILAPILLVSIGLDGYYSHVAANLEPRVLGASLDGVHLLTVLVWTGGLVHFFLYLRQPDAQASVQVAASHRFSHLAMACVALVGASGLLMVGVMVGWAPAAWVGALSTQYGRLLAYKVFLALVMMGLGAVNHYAFVRRYEIQAPPARWPLFLGNVRREAFNGVLVLMVAAAVTNLTPA